MADPSVIKILISCPSDVTTEKEQIIQLCKDFSEANHGKSNIILHTLDWKSYVGGVGSRPQQQLKEYFGIYDVYIGIMWKRFGTNPSSVNAMGNENESGTEEEFYDAIEYNSKYFRPKIYFFFKTYDRASNNSIENEQLGKVLKFIEEQKEQNNNFLNFFDSPNLFNSIIVKLLKSVEYNHIHENLKEDKENSLTEKTKIKITEFKADPAILPIAYIERTTSHFRFLKDQLTNQFLEIEHKSLDQLMISSKRVVLLGDAGSGKSTELRNLNKKLSLENSIFVSILQSLNSYTPEQGLEDYLPDFWKEVPNNLLIIWDGLDEIESKNFNTVVRQINSFSEKHKEIRILISCRTNFYELPLINSESTLPEFEPYYINDLTLKDVKTYYSKKYSSTESDNFINEIFENNLSDLVTKPFFLMLLADRFNQEHSLQLNRAELYEMFLANRIKLDQNHFKTSVDLRSKKQEIILLLQNVAVSMEILSKNQIKESEILELITSTEFNSLKYCTAFKKKCGEDDIWHFEHNNIQEFLAAKALSNLEFDKVIQFIAFAPNYEKLIPSWVNTLAFLFSILDSKSNLFDRLLHWMLKNDKEYIVKFESDKIAENLRVQIFQGIFNYYKTHDVSISSNKFSDRELAKFGQSELNLRFLIKEIKSEENTKTVHINAISLIGHFLIEVDGLKQEIERLLLEQIDRNISEPNFIAIVINSLKLAGIAEANTIKELMGKVGNRKNQYIRAAMYSILSKSDVQEGYVNYLIEGYELKDQEISGERDDVNLINEGWNLKECVKGIKTVEGIKELVEYVSESTKFADDYDSGNVIEAIVSNAVEAYGKDHSVFTSLLNWFKKEIREIRFEKTNLLLQFFNQTNTREHAFQEIWISKEDEKKMNKSLAIAKLLTPELMQFIIDEFLSQNLTNEELEGIYFDMVWVNNENFNLFEKLIQENTDFKIKKPEHVDCEALRKKKLKIDFKLLFDQQEFKDSAFGIFEKEQKDILSFDELFKMRTENNRCVDIDEYYPSVSLSFLRDFMEKDQSVSKKNVMNWFEGETNEEWYRVSLIYNYLTNHKELEINIEQKKWIEQWCTVNVSKVNFKEAIEVHDNGKFTFKTMAVYIWYFSKRFDINHQKSILLDMLSFDYFNGNDWVGIEYIIAKLYNNDIVDRMLENIKEGIADSSVLKNHIKYLAQNKIKQSYPFILNEIINLKRSDHQRRELLDLYFEYTKDTESIKSIIDLSDSIIRWDILDKLKSNNQESYVVEYLLTTLEKNIDNEEIGKAAQMLVSLQNIKGLQVYVEWIKNNFENDVDISRAMCLNSLTTGEAIPYLIELLELSYIRKIKITQFDRFNAQILGAFYNIALISEENFKKVKSNLQEFITEKSSVHESVKYILHTIERIEEQFYMKNAQSFNIKQVKEKLKLLE